jgi:hypothetical protein
MMQGVETVSGSMIYIQSFIKIGIGVQTISRSALRNLETLILVVLLISMYVVCH